MIRPLTCLTFLLACGSGLYLYQSKHSVHVLDHQIDQTIKATETLREQTRMLHAEWTLLNDPERLRQLSDQFLTLKTVSPGQFTSLADLDSRLPAPVAAPAPAPETVPVAGLPPEPAAPAIVATTDETRMAQEDPEVSPLPVPPIAPPAPPPPAAPRIAAATPPAEQQRSPDRKPPPSRPTIIQQSMPRVATSEPRPAEPRPVEARVEQPHVYEPHPFVARPIVAAAPPQPVFNGSLLGMARGTPGVPAPLPAPRPVPMNATEVLYNQGG